MQSTLSPPGLEPSTASPWPHMSPCMATMGEVYSADATVKQPSGQGQRNDFPGRLNSRRGSEASTAAASSLELDTPPRASPAASGRDSPVPKTSSVSSGTSAMMRNLPNDYTRCMLLDLLHSEGFGGTFDFVYLPVDFRSTSGLGYAFVNFALHDDAECFREHFTGFNRWSLASDKVCEVTWSSLQGLEAHIERYRNSPVMHESVPDDQKPVLFRGLERVQFPSPTKAIRTPRHWHRRR